MSSSDFDWKRVRRQQVMQVLLQLMLVMIWHLATLGKVMPFARNFVKGGQQRCFSGFGFNQVCPIESCFAAATWLRGLIQIVL